VTIEDVLGIKDPEILEKMSDDELLNHFKLYLDITRPERVAPQKRMNPNANPIALIAANPKLDWSCVRTLA
jgi:hypothetical protein